MDYSERTIRYVQARTGFISPTGKLYIIRAHLLYTIYLLIHRRIYGGMLSPSPPKKKKKKYHPNWNRPLPNDRSQ